MNVAQGRSKAPPNSRRLWQNREEKEGIKGRGGGGRNVASEPQSAVWREEGQGRRRTKKERIRGSEREERAERRL